MTVYRTVNAAWQMGHNAALIREVAKGADVLALVECRDARNRPVNVKRILGADWWVQQDLRSGARAGSVTAVRKGSGVGVKRSSLRRLSDRGHKVQVRYQRVTVLRDHGQRVVLTVAHNPLPSTGRMRQAVTRTQAWVRARARVVWLWAGDANADPRTWARVLGASGYHGVRPMVMAWSRGFNDSGRSVRKRVPGTDHAVLTVTTAKEKR